MQACLNDDELLQKQDYHENTQRMNGRISAMAENNGCILNIGNFFKDESYIMTKWPGGIAVFTAAAFEDFIGRIHEKRQEQDGSARSLIRYFEASAVELERVPGDSILVPPYLQAFAGFDEETELILCQIQDDEYGELYFLTAAGNQEAVFAAYHCMRIEGHFLAECILWKGKPCA